MAGELDKLRKANSQDDLAKLLGYKLSPLTYIIYRMPKGEKYSEFKIPKKSGGDRIIKAPAPKLKKLQSHLANFLYLCLSDIEKEQEAQFRSKLRSNYNGKRTVSFAFRRELTIMDNADCHRGHRWVLNLDLKDFFPSFNFGRVRGFFLKNKYFTLNKEVATTIAQIACTDGALPQGSPCSPIISEFITRILDMRLLKLAKVCHATYTRYADDITFSTNQKEFPDVLAKPKNSEMPLWWILRNPSKKALNKIDFADSPEWILSKRLLKEIERAGFSVNEQKTRMSHHRNRQMVTGLIVNRKVNVEYEYYHKVRAMCDSLMKKGFYYSDKNKFFIGAPKAESDLTLLEGKLNFVWNVKHHFEKTEARNIARKAKKSKTDTEITSIDRLYKLFLMYRFSFGLDMPLLITEGKTDVVYIKKAVMGLNSFPHLGEVKGDKFCNKIRYFSHSAFLQRIFNLGGTGNLGNWLLSYKEFLSKKSIKERLKLTHLPYPIILLLDNDKGLKPVAAIAKNNFDGIELSQETKDDFYYLSNNLYIVKTPEKYLGDKLTDSCIENLFPEKWLSMPLADGKKFNYKTEPDIKTEYGKEVFAQKIIKPNAAEIDFSAFSPLLERILKAVEDYKQRTHIPK